MEETFVCYAEKQEKGLGNLGDFLTLRKPRYLIIC